MTVSWGTSVATRNVLVAYLTKSTVQRCTSVHKSYKSFVPSEQLVSVVVWPEVHPLSLAVRKKQHFSSEGKETRVHRIFYQAPFSQFGFFFVC